jgi:hypothetical protein
MNDSGSPSPESREAGQPGLLPREVVFGLLLTATSGAAIIAHTFGPVRMSFTVPFVVLPTTAVVVGLILLRRGLHDRLHRVSSFLMWGGIWGLAGTLCYDAIRPLLKWVLAFQYDPFRAMPIFGSLITGLSTADPVAVAAGWVYHFWNGISFGMMFVLLRPKGGPVQGLIWAMLLQALMMAVYPSFLRARLDDPGFLTMGIVGHALWGLVLGAGLRWRGGDHA